MRFYEMPPISYTDSNLNDFKRDINIIIYRKNYYILTDITLDDFESAIEKYNDPIGFYTISIGARPRNLWGQEGDLNLCADIKSLIKSVYGWDEYIRNIIDKNDYVLLCESIAYYLIGDKNFESGVMYHVIRKVVDLLLVPITSDFDFKTRTSYSSVELGRLLNRLEYKFRIGNEYS